MYLRRYNPLNPIALYKSLNSYYRNPTPEKRRRIEEMLQHAIKAMDSVEHAMAESHRQIKNLFQEFLSFEEELPESQEEDFLEEAIFEEAEKPSLVDPETGEPRFKQLRRAYSGNEELEEQLNYLSREIAQLGKVKINDAKAIMGIDSTSYVRRLLDRLIKRKLLRTEGKTSSKTYIWIGELPLRGETGVQGRRIPEAEEMVAPEQVSRPTGRTQPPTTEIPNSPPFRVLPRALAGNPELEAQLKYLLNAIMRRGEVKIGDAKAIMEIGATPYVRGLLDRLTKRKFLKTSGKTKAKIYRWSGEYPEWAPAPPKRSLDTSCPRCGSKMKKKGTYLRCPKRGCSGKREIGSGEVKKLPSSPPITSEAEIISKILNETANNPTKVIFVHNIMKHLNIRMPEPAFKKLLEKQPELEIKRDEIIRKSDDVFKCPYKKDRQYTKIAYATRADGTQPARRGWLNINKKARSYFTKLFERMCEHNKIEDGTKFKRLVGDIWEFKSNTHKRRIACFMEGGVIYLTHIFKKKEDKTPPQEIAVAEAIRSEHLQRMGRNKRHRFRHHRRRNPYRYGPYKRVQGSLYRGLRHYPY